MLPNKLYDTLKEATQLWLPASGTLYFTMAEIWDFPAGAEVVASLAAVSTFFGVILKVSRTQYVKSDADVDGHMVVHDTAEGGKMVSLELGDDPEPLTHQQRVVFKVVDAPPGE